MVLATDCEIQGTVNNHTYLAAKQVLLKLVQGSCMSADAKKHGGFSAQLQNNKLVNEHQSVIYLHTLAQPFKYAGR